MAKHSALTGHVIHPRLTDARSAARILSALLALAALSLPADSGAQTTRVSVSLSGTEANGPSRSPALSGDGRFVAFISEATNLTPEGVPGTFVHDRTTGMTTLVSTSIEVRPDLSDDGRYVLVGTAADPGVEVLDRQTGFRQLIPRLGAGPYFLFYPSSNEYGSAPDLSGDGRHVAFAVDNGATVYVYRLDDGSVCSAHVSSTGEPPNVVFVGGRTSLSLTSDGSRVAFGSWATNLAADDTDPYPDVFIHDCVTGETILASDGPHGNNSASEGRLDRSGRYVLFGSSLRDTHSGVTSTELPQSLYGESPNVLAGAARRIARSIAMPFGRHGVQFQSHVHDAFAGQSLRLDVTPTGGDADALLTYDFGGETPAFGISHDGRLVAFKSPASNLVAGDTNGVTDIFVRDWTDPDGDNMNSAWEQAFGLNPYDAADAAADPDGDGQTNAQEHAAGTHPLGVPAHTRYLAEGAATAFFDTRIVVANPSPSTSARVVVRLTKSDGTSVWQVVSVPASQSAIVQANMLLPTTGAEFSTVVESDVPVVVDRRMQWSRGRYGAHAETALAAAAPTWHLAEGSTAAGFQLFYLLQNPGATSAQVRVRFLLPSGAPLDRTYTVPARSRFTVWVNQIAALASTDVSAVVDVLSGPNIIVERAMYLSSPTQVFAAGHEAAGVTAPALEWTLAEGATGTYFDEFVLLSNPGSSAALVQATYLLPGGTTYQKAYTVPAMSRTTIWVDREQIAGATPLANTAVSVKLVATNAVPFVAERAMWWPGTAATWQEAHVSAGATASATRWAVADGEVTTGSDPTDTYLLIANVSNAAATVQVHLLLDQDSTNSVVPAPNLLKDFSVPANSRFNVNVRAEFPDAVGRGFGALVESLGPTPSALVVERSIYRDAGGVRWAAGANALAVPLP